MCVYTRYYSQRLTLHTPDCTVCTIIVYSTVFIRYHYQYPE